MTKILLGFIFIALTTGQIATAATTNLELYHTLIEAQRDSAGKLIQLVIKPAAVMTDGLSSSDNNTLDIVSVFQNRLNQLSASPGFLTRNTQVLSAAGWSQDDIKNYKQAQNILASGKDVQKVLGNKIISRILREFQKDLNMIFQFNVIAKPGVPGYFHDRALIDKALKKALSAAENALGTTPALRAVSFLLNTALGWVEEKRSYSQNILLYYIEKVPAGELGLTTHEVSFIKSSIFERQIALWDFQKLEEAKKNWSNFGTGKFSDQINNNSARLTKYGASHGENLANFNFAFTAFVKNNINYILNTQDQKSKLSKDLSTAFDGSAPQHIRNFRIELQLTQLAASFLPAPGFVMDQLNGLLGSYYSSQKLTEGALFAYLLTQNDLQLGHIILEQSINPILIHDLK